MGSKGFIQMPLRGYVPYHGELDPAYDLARLPQLLAVPMWEGSDRPYLYSRTMTGSAGTIARPDPIVAGQFPRWSHDPIAGAKIGAPMHSGHVGQLVHAGGIAANVAKGWLWSNVFDSIVSRFVVNRNFSVLLVGTPLFMSDATTTPSNNFRELWHLKSDLSTPVQRITYNYLTGQFVWFEFAVSGTSTPAILTHGERVAFLFVHGDENGVITSPRVFVGRENGEITRADFPTLVGASEIQTSKHLGAWASAGSTKVRNNGGGAWEYLAFFFRNFTAAEARAVLRDAVGMVKMDPYPIRRRNIIIPVHGEVSASSEVVDTVSASSDAVGTVRAEGDAIGTVRAEGEAIGTVRAEGKIEDLIDASAKPGEVE